MIEYLLALSFYALNEFAINQCLFQRTFNIFESKSDKFYLKVFSHIEISVNERPCFFTRWNKWWENKTVCNHKKDVLMIYSFVRFYNVFVWFFCKAWVKHVLLSKTERFLEHTLQHENIPTCLLTKDSTPQRNNFKTSTLNAKTLLHMSDIWN